MISDRWYFPTDRYSSTNLPAIFFAFSQIRIYISRTLIKNAAKRTAIFIVRDRQASLSSAFARFHVA